MSSVLDERLAREFTFKEDRGVILCGMWSLWNCRNDRKYVKTPIDPRSAIDGHWRLAFSLLPHALHGRSMQSKRSNGNH
jgi:hypothetical protein